LSWVKNYCIWANNFLPAGPRGVGAGRELTQWLPYSSPAH
jgi:hypothetical protein